MSNKALIVPQLDKLEKYHETRQARCEGILHVSNYHHGYLNAIEQFRSMLEGVDVTVGLEDDDGI